MLPKSLPLKLLVVFGIIAVGWFTFLNQWSGGGPGQLAAPASLDGSSFFDDYDNLTYVDPSSLNNVSWDGQSAISYSYSAGGGGGGGGEIDPASPLGVGLAGLWHFNGNANDSTAFGQNGVLTGPAVACNAVGMFGTQACSFSGGYVSDEVRVSFDSTKPVFNIDNAEPFTVSAWIYPLGLNNYAGLVGRAWGTTWLLSSGDNSNSIGFYVDGTRLSTDPNSVALNTWTHVAATFDGATKRIYLNGALSKTQTVSNITMTDTSPLRIGGNGSGDEWNGKIDEVAVWNRTLSATEALSLATPSGGGASGSFESIAITPSSPINSLTLAWTETAAGTSVDISPDNGANWCTMANNTTLSNPTCTTKFPTASFKYRVNFSAQTSLSNIRFDWTTAPAGDTTSPTVSVTAPANGATVSGAAVTVSANASDNVGVAGVQFKLDGTNLNTEDTTSPYSTTWNTTLASNGSHSLTAMARDAAGNSATSGTITVTVSNALDTQAPSMPANLTATAVSSSQINLAWSASFDNIAVTGYKIFRAGTQIATSPTNTYQDTGLSPSTTYTYTVSAFDAAGNNSLQSASASAATQAGQAGLCDFVVSPTGNDANPGTETQPWKTLTKAGNTATAGKTVCIKAGTYNETLRPANSGTAGNLITFKAYPTDACEGGFKAPKLNCDVVIDGGRIRENGVYLYGRRYIRIEGFDVRNHIDAAIYVQDYYDNIAEGLQLVNNYIHDNGDTQNWSGRGHAIHARNLRQSLIENNEIYRNGYSAIFIPGLYGARDVVIRGNRIHYNGADGVRGGGTNVTIEENLIFDQFHTSLHQDGLDLAGNSSNLVVRNNIIFDLTQLIYFPAKDAPDTLLENIEISGNVLYTDRYWTVAGGEAPGVFIDARRSGNVVRNVNIHSNTFGWLGYSGIRIYDDGVGQVSGIVLRNNIFYDSRNIDVSIRALQEVSSNYNLFYGDAAPWATEGANSLRFNPGFVNYQRHSAWDFRLKSTSPAIDQGALGSIPVPASFTDLWGNLRPQDGPDADTIAQFDIGAYEYPSGAPSGDTTPPTVSLTAPANGSTVSGNTVTISATASDNVGVAGVQFKVNGVNQGTEVTTAPWSVSWNTALVANGTYTLTAAARDNAGNTATSPNVTVTVSNVSQPPPTGNLYYVAPTGNDANPGTLASPWRTLAKAGAAARAGDTVYIRAGTYNETLTPQNSGTAGNLITFKAYPGEGCQGAPGQPKIAGSCKVKIDGTGSLGSGVDLHGKSYIRVEGFEIKLWSENGIYGNNYVDTMTKDIEVVNNYIHDVGLGNVGNTNEDGSALLATHIDILLFQDNEIFNTGDAGISCSGPFGCKNFTIRGNNIHRTGQDGIMTNAWRGDLGDPNNFLYFAENFLIENNVFYDSFLSGQHQDGINTHSARNWIIRNNVLSDYTQLIYFPLGDSYNSIAENIQIYGNVFYNEHYKADYGGDTQCIFFGDGLRGNATQSYNIIRNISIHSNTCGWVGYGPIWIFGTTGTVMSNIKITNNIFFDKAPAVSGGTITGLYSNYNLYFKSSAPAFEGPNSVTATDPQFANYVAANDPSYTASHAPYDFRLQPTSPVIDKGALGLITVPANFTDLWGNLRPQGSGFDIGAYEYPGGGTGDTTPPTVSLTAPTNGATVSGSAVTVSANASDNVGVAGVQFKVNGVNLGAEDTSSPYSVNWNTTSATNGAHTLTAVARDAAGNTTTAVAVGVTVNNVVSTKFTIGDRVITTAAVNVRDAPNGNILPGSPQPQGTLGTVTGGPTAAGGYVWWSINYDSGPDGWSAETFLDKYTPPTGGDTTAPIVVILSPAPGAAVSDTVIISASALDPTVTGQTTSGLAGVQFKINGVNQGTEVVTSPWSISWNTAAIPNGTYTLTAAARDNAGNTATSPNVTVTVSNVSQPPPTGNLYYVAPTGNDANPGTLASPWRTLAKAGAAARAGDTVYIRAGTYNETLRPFNSGTAGNLITFKAAPGEECQGAFAQPKTAGSCKVIIDGQNSRSAGIDLSRPNKYVKIEGFEIKNHIGDGGIFFQGWGATGVEGIEIVNNYVHSNKEEGIWAKNSWNSLFENNEIYNNGRGGVGGTAIEIGGQVGSKGAILRGNNIHFNEKDGIRGACQDCLIELNRIYDMFHTGKHQDGLDLAYSQINVTIRNNTIYDLTQLIYFPLKDESGWKIENVSIYGNVLYNERYWSVNGGESQCIFLDARVRPENTVKNVSIYANTCGWTGYQSLWIYGTGNNIDTVKVKNNIFNGMDFGAITNLDVSDNIDSRTIDPKFVAYSGKGSTSFNLHLQSSSPAIDKGANLASVVTLPSPFKDIDGTIRPQGTAYDIGAYEYASVGTTAICGNGVIESSEQCDGANLGGQTCTARGFTGGTLSCTSVCTFNTSQCTTATTDTTAPSVPFGFTATPVSSTQINLAWSAATDNVGVTGYKLYRNNGTVPIALVSATSYQDSSLNANTTYTYQVSAYDAAGNESAKSAGISATTLPAPDSTPPTISAVTATSIGTDRATITWTTDEPATSQVDYGFDTSYNQSTALQTALVTSHSQTLTGLTAHATYHYRVKSKDAGGLESTSVDFAFTTLPAPLADTTAPQTIADLRVSGTERKSAALAWTAPYQDLTSATSGPVASYDLRYSRDPITETNWDSSSVAQASGAPTPALPGAAETYTLVDLSPNKTYYAALRSTDAAVNLSALSNVVSFTTSAEPRGGGGGGGGGSSGGSIATADTTAPTSPTTVTIQAADRQAILRWQNPTTTDFVRMLVLRSFVPLPVITSPGNPRYLPMATVVADTNLPYFTDTNLTNGQLYYYTLYAYDRSGNWARPVTMTATPSRTAGQTLDRQTFTPAQRASLLLELRRRLLELLIKLLTLLRGQQIQ